MTIWQFSTPPTQPRSPEVVLVAFGRGPLTGPLELPAAAAELCELRTIDRRVAPDWFDAWRGGSLRAIAEKDLGPQLADLDASDHAHVITSAPKAPADLGYLCASLSERPGGSVWGRRNHLAGRGGIARCGNTFR
ncbi:MAG: hypothetical protein SFX73_00600 [Kofleriaceae bacterium]|nr:hypothetical protein [Kofleriaceae bacterium]